MEDIVSKLRYENYEYFKNGLDLRYNLVKNVSKKDLVNVLIELEIVNEDVTLDTYESEHVLYFDENIPEDCTEFVIEICPNDGAGDWGDNYHVYSLDTYIEKTKNTLECLQKFKEE